MFWMASELQASLLKSYYLKSLGVSFQSAIPAAVWTDVWFLLLHSSPHAPLFLVLAATTSHSEWEDGDGCWGSFSAPGAHPPLPGGWRSLPGAATAAPAPAAAAAAGSGWTARRECRRWGQRRSRDETQRRERREQEMPWSTRWWIPLWAHYKISKISSHWLFQSMKPPFRSSGGRQAGRRPRVLARWWTISLGVQRAAET